MRKSIFAIASTTALLSLPAVAVLALPALAFAETESNTSDTFAQIGGGYHSSFVSENSNDYEASFDSPVFSARLIPQENVALESNYYYPGAGDYTKGTDSGRSVFDVSGLELNMLLSTSLVDEGFYAYTGVGLFSETWESTSSGNQYVATGLQLPVGVGYNFGKFSIDAQFALRDPDSYTKDVFSADDASMNEANTVKFRLFANL
ncbi:hypothetical protein [Marinomonas balearica]|uniref:Outer membrane protein beta-barrel domain-containing protein n=1 Tax=Marinomonas balearica TaxID=491947 RepID=A0A4R6MIN3_9GAMM|nr:hypothetical protein [Marinomonas balearica]TDP01858.1 hypothetical protein DFP79_0032 [Marinomonas balearica]